MALLPALLALPAAAAVPPGQHCAKAKSRIEKRICADPGLSALNSRLAGVFATALSREAGKTRTARLRAEQRGWIKRRDDCLKSRDQTACLRDQYRRRMAELQARYALVPSLGPFRFVCRPGDIVTVTYFLTDKPMMIARRGKATSLMFIAPSASGARYEGRNESFWEHQGEARIVWGRGAPAMTCPRQR